MSSLTKLDLNKQIVLMRHNVNRAKIQIIHKLTRQIKSLKEKKASDNLKIKNEKKAERLMNEILIMKKIPKDEVAAFSLSNTKKVADILSDVDSSNRLRVLARLSLHKSIVPVVRQFRNNYPSWEKDFSKVLIALKKRQKLKHESNDEAQENKKLNETKTDVEQDSQSDEEGNANCDSGNELVSSDNESLDSDSSPGIDEEIIENDVENLTNLDNSIVVTRGNRFSVSSDDFNTSDLPQKKMNFGKNKKYLEEINFDKSFEKHGSKIIVKNESENDLDDPQTGNATLIGECENFSKLPRTKKNIDPFFIGDNDKEYETCNPIVENNFKESCRPDKTKLNFDTKNSKFNNRDKIKRLDYNNKSNFKQNKFDNFSTSLKNNTKQKFGNKRSNDVKTVPSKAAIKLHPSWEAKKKLPSIANFSGKKIVFD